MLKILFIGLLAVKCSAGVTSPLEADFPAGYWDRETLSYGSAMTTYNISLAVKEPAALRAQVEKIGKASNAVLSGFSDQTAFSAASRLGPEYAGMPRARQAYTLSYRLPLSKAAEIARQIIELGRLISYTTNMPYGVTQARELDDKIQWIERELKESAGPLKNMPVSRALLEAKLKALKQSKDLQKASDGVATITVQIQFEDAESPDHSGDKAR